MTDDPDSFISAKYDQYLAPRLKLIGQANDLTKKRGSEISEVLAIYERALAPPEHPCDVRPDLGLIAYEGLLRRLESAPKHARLQVLAFLAKFPPTNSVLVLKPLRQLIVQGGTEMLLGIVNVLKRLKPDVASFLAQCIAERLIQLDHDECWRSACDWFEGFSEVNFSPLVPSLTGAVCNSPKIRTQLCILELLAAKITTNQEPMCVEKLCKEIDSERLELLLRDLEKPGQKLRRWLNPAKRPPYYIVGSTLICDGQEYEIGEPYLVKWLQLLLEVWERKEGKIVSGDELNSAGGVRSSNVPRDMGGLKKLCPPLKDIIQSRTGPGAGYRLVSKKNE